MSHLSRHLASKSFSIFVLLIFALLTSKAALAQGDAALTPLELNKPIERSIAGDDAHSYTLTLAAGQYAHVIVIQKAVDTVVVVYGSGGNKLFDVESPNVNLPVWLVADSATTYRLEVKSQTRATRYEIKLQELRKATQEDRSRVAAPQLAIDARTLRDKRTEQSYEQAIEKYLAALDIWRNLDDKPMQASTLDEAGWLYGDIGQYQKSFDCYARSAALY